MNKTSLITPDVALFVVGCLTVYAIGYGVAYGLLQWLN